MDTPGAQGLLNVQVLYLMVFIIVVKSPMTEISKLVHALTISQVLVMYISDQDI